jgi:SAM-dependent methyltransferase
VYCCDVRDMSRFADDSFDFILFSFNGLDYIPHEGRLKALAEIKRILSLQGIFVFSSHNRTQLEEPDRGATSRKIYSPKIALKRKIWRILLFARRLRARRYEVATDEYAIINDSGLRYSLLTYYISIRSQIDQLKQLAFVVDGIFDTEGKPAQDNDRSPWIHYVVRK